MAPTDERRTAAPSLPSPDEAEAAARDAVAAFAAAWAGSVYGNHRYFDDLRSHLDAYRDAVESRVRAELATIAEIEAGRHA